MRPARWLATIGTVLGASAVGKEAPPGQTRFNVTCPAPRLLPVLDRAYHDCNHGFMDGSCEAFVESFRKLAPEYDCQRSFDATPSRNYIVPAVWLAGNGALEDYINLMYRLASSDSPKGKMFSEQLFRKATNAAEAFFGSEDFRRVLDGDLAEQYLPLSRAVERKQQRKSR